VKTCPSARSGERGLTKNGRPLAFECTYLVGDDTCRAVKEGDTDRVVLRLEACQNETKDACCHLCSMRNCEIRCDLLKEQRPMKKPKGSDSPHVISAADSPRECGNCIYYLEPECPRGYDRDTGLWRRQAPCEILRRVDGEKTASTVRAGSPLNIEELKGQVQEYREELNKAYGNYERLEKAIKDLQEETKAKDETILNLKKQLKAQKAKTRGTATDQGTRKSKPVPVAQPEPNMGDQAVYRYIADHSGTVSLEKAAQDLRIPMDELRRTIERLKRTGRITQG